jgi:CRISPR-associated protein Csd2
MFDHDRSAANGEMASRGLIVFEHESDLGNAPAHKLFERVTTVRTDGVDGSPPRSFEDYSIWVNETDLPRGVSIQRLI